MSVVDTDVVDKYQMKINGSINSTASINSGKVIGNPTEGAILLWIGNFYKDIRETLKVATQKPFNSTDKYMLTEVDAEVKSPNGKLVYVYVKGAPEVIAKLINDDSFLSKVAEQQARGRRAISFASGTSMNDLTYDGTVFIEDPVW